MCFFHLASEDYAFEMFLCYRNPQHSKKYRCTGNATICKGGKKPYRAGNAGNGCPVTIQS